MRNFGFVILAYSCLAGLSFLDNGRGVTYPLILKSFSLDGNSGALIFSLASLSGLIVNFTSKLWLSALGLVVSTRFFIGMLLLGAQGFYFSDKFLSVNMLYLASLVAGIGFGGIGVTMNLMVSEGAPINFRRRFLSGLHGMYGLASFGAPLLFNLLVDHNFSWSEYFFAISLIFIFIFILSFFVKDTHKETFKASTQQKKESFYTTLIVGLMVGFYVSSEVLVTSRITLYLTESGLALKDANKILSLFFVSLLSGRFLFAGFNLKFKNESLLIISLISTLTFFYVGVNYNSYSLALCGFSMSYFFPVSVEYINEKFHKSSARMISNVLAYVGINVMLMHNVFGYLSTKFGVLQAFNLFYLLNIVSIIFLIYLRRHLRRF